jgi:uncharacterized membrane protein (DUF485 family)
MREDRMKCACQTCSRRICKGRLSGIRQCSRTRAFLLPLEHAVHDHENVREEEQPELVARNTRIGLGLFAIYFALYAGFMGLSTFAPDVMKVRYGGINLSVLYGFGLILAALILAIVYLLLCRRPVAGAAAVSAKKEG